MICWNEAAGDVQIDQVFAVLQKNARLAQRVIRKALQYFPEQRSCSCATSLKDALVTERSKIPKKTRKDLDLLIGKYL